ncbi:reverse transcriptase domain-containing protein [Tanacetum coccineum]
MPFGLKNARATYQRLVDKFFSKQIGRNLEAYVDDMVIKRTFEEGMLSDIQETFERFRSINTKLNPKNCSFGVEEGPFLGHLITKQGIKANPLKIKAVTELEQPRALKDIQSLNGKLAVLSHEADKAFKEMKKFVQALPKLIAPRAGETLIMYLAASKESINVALLQKEVKGRSPSTSKKASKILLSSHNNGSHSSDGARAGLMLIDPAGKEYTYALRFEFETTNKEEEYEALLAGLGIAQEMEITKVAIFLDSQLVVNQIKETYAAKQLSIKSYLQKVKTALKGFKGYTVEHVRRNQNKKADALSKLASMTFKHLTKEVLVEVLAKRSIEEKVVLKVEIEEKRSWMSPIQECPEAAKAIQDCEKCKEQSAIRKVGVDGAMAVESTWPFSHWGIHILGPLPMALGGLQFLAIAVKHSTKWVEAKPITVKNVREVEKFVWEYVVCRFGDGEGFIISAGGDIGFEEGAEDRVASLEEGTDI